MIILVLVTLTLIVISIVIGQVMMMMIDPELDQLLGKGACPSNRFLWWQCSRWWLDCNLCGSNNRFEIQWRWKGEQNRKMFPVSLNKVCKLARGESRYRCKGSITCMVWQDRRPITFISNLHDPKPIGVANRRNKDGTLDEVPMPQLVQDYNRHMGGCDKMIKWRASIAHAVITGGPIAFSSNFSCGPATIHLLSMCLN